MQKVIYLLPLLILTSCYTQKSAIEKFGCHQKDSVRVDTFIKDVKIPIYLPGDTIKISVSSPCDSTGHLKPFKKEIKGKNGRVTGILFSDVLHNVVEVDCFEQEYRDSLHWKDTLVRYYEQKVFTNPVIPESSWTKFKNTCVEVLAFMGLISLLCIFLYILIKFVIK